MKLYKSKGIVLKTSKLGEADKIITILSPKNGKIQAVAKGIRKTKSKFGARLEPFTYVNLLLYEGKSLDIITQVEIITSFKQIRNDLDKVTRGGVMLELINKSTQMGEKAERIFYLLLNSLKQLARTNNYELFLAAFQIELMSILGYRLYLENCISCGKDIPQEEIYLSFGEGGIICNKCKEEKMQSISISKKCLNLIKRINTTDCDQWYNLSASEQTLSEISEISQLYVDYYLEAPLKSRHLLKLK